MGRFGDHISSHRDELGAQMADIRAAIGGAEEETAQITSTTATSPVVDNTFTPIITNASKGNKARCKATLAFADFGNAVDLRVVMVQRDEILTSDDYQQKRFVGFLSDGIDDNGRSAQRIVAQIDKRLHYGVTIDIIRLVALGEDSKDKAKNPADDPLYSGYPGNVVYSFVTSSGNLANLTAVSLTLESVEPWDGRHGELVLHATQPADPVILFDVGFHQKKTSDVDYILRDHKSLKKIKYNTGGLAFERRYKVRLKPNREYDFKATIQGIDGSTRDVTLLNQDAGDMLIPGKNYLFSTHNLVKGGQFLNSSFDYDSGKSNDTAGEEWYCNFAATRINNLLTGVAGASIDSHGVQWEMTTANPKHRLRLTRLAYTPTAFRFGVKVRKQIIPGQVYSFSFYAAASTTLSMQFAAVLYDDASGTIVQNILDLVVLTTSYLMIATIFEVPGTYNQSGGNQHLFLVLNSDPGVGHEIYLDDWAMYKNKQILPHSAHPDEAGLNPTFDVTVDTGAGALASFGGGGNANYLGTEIVVGGGGVLVIS
jgi:hypothetical protein